MSIKIPIETSARHLHISQEDFEKLFGEGSKPHFIKELSQPGQYLCRERVTVKGPKDTFENMALLGPFRSDTQVEMSLTDTRKLGIPSVIRQSGDIEGTPGCILSGPCGDIEIPRGVIVAKRHIHMTPDEALALHIKDNDEVFVLTKSYGRSTYLRRCSSQSPQKLSPGNARRHCEANAFNSDTEPYGVIVRFFDSNFNTDKWIEDELSGIRR